MDIDAIEYYGQSYLDGRYEGAEIYIERYSWVPVWWINNLPKCPKPKLQPTIKNVDDSF